MTVKFIAEISSNHQCDYQRALALITTAAEIGCSAVKFQLFKLDQLFTPEALKAKPFLNERRAWELPLEWLSDLATTCHEQNLQFICTPFYWAAVEVLEPHVDVYKVASYNLLDVQLLRLIGQTGKPVIMSTGLATMAELTTALNTLTTAGSQDITLLHCVSEYPVPPERCNLNTIVNLRLLFQLPVGWSDHSRSPAVLYRAIHRFGVKTIEFHLDLDGTGNEYHLGHCWLPDEIATVIDNINLGQSSDGVLWHQRPMTEESLWRADPSDGKRPLLSKRMELQDVE